MRGRQSVWSNEQLQKIARKKFVPAADEVVRLQNCNAPECQYFQRVAEQDPSINPGPSNSQQGIWVATPSGKLLGSLNTHSVKQVRDMFVDALKKWQSMSDDERLLTPEQAKSELNADVHRPEDRYPENGLVLKAFSRDLPRKNPGASGWKADAWNMDQAWFKEKEARSFVPERIEQGQTRQVPEKLIHRLARFHLVDNIRGQTRPFPSSAVRKARLTSTVMSVEAESVSLKLKGMTRTRHTGKWPVCGADAENDAKQRERGFHAQLLGHATYNRKTNRFETFELMASGMRWGGTQYNGRCNDLEPSPLGIYFTKASDRPANRVAPAFIGKYQWN